MARYKPQEIVRRDAVPARRAEVPVLAVHADQEPSRTSGSLAKTAGSGLDMLGNMFAQYQTQQRVKRAEQAEADFNEGVAYRQQEIILGMEHPTPDYVLGDLSADLLRGSQAADFPHQLQRWQREAAQKLATLEPDEDPEPHLQGMTAGLLNHAAMQDTRLRNNAMTLLQDAVTEVRTEHQKATASELLTRQQEALNANIQAEMRKGTPLEEIVEHTRALTNTAEFGYLHNREADAFSANAIADALASGEVDTAAVLDELTRITDAQGVSFLDGKHGDALRLAASKGAGVREAQQAEARKNAQVELERPLRELARQGRLTDDKVFEVADRLGMAGQERLEFIRRWFNKQEDGIKAIQADAEKRRKEAERDALARRGLLWLSDDAARKVLDTRLFAATQANDTDAIAEVLDDAININLVPTFYKNVLQRGGYDDAEAFAEQSRLYQELRERSPAFANKASGSKAAVFDDYQAEVVVGGLPAQGFLARQGTTKRSADEAAYAINAALKDARREYATIVIGGEEVPRPEGDWFSIRKRAAEIAAEHPGVAPDSALKAAVEEWDGGFTSVNGRRVPNQSLPPQAQEGVETFVQELARALKLDEGALTAYPSLGNSEQWLVLGEDGFPISDPETGARVVFNPTRVGRLHQEWKQGLAAVRTRDKALEAQMKRLQQRLYVPQAGAGPFQNTRTDRLNREKAERDQATIDALMASPDYQDMLRNREFRTTEIGGIPVDFMRYLERQQGN